MNAWRCDRCGAVSTGGNVDDPPDGWRPFTAPVRGSDGAKSTLDAVICDGCDESLYEWFSRREAR